MTDLEKQLLEAKKLYDESNDSELRDMAKNEIIDLKRQIDNENPINQRSAVLEIRSGTGGDEAELFAGDLFRMYQRYAEIRGWKLEIADSNLSDLKGVKSLTAIIKGNGAYSDLRFEGGVHRVQRVPKTEKSGRVHTSAASVVVLPEAKDIDVNIRPNDIRIDVYRSGGCGGQSVNTTDSAVRITHIPTGLVVTCQDERSQLKNKDKAMGVLRSRLWDYEQQKQDTETGDARKLMIKSGDRSDKIRTYNYPQNRVTDHRINKNWYGIDSITGGHIEEIVQGLKEANLGIDDN